MIFNVAIWSLVGCFATNKNINQAVSGVSKLMKAPAPSNAALPPWVDNPYESKQRNQFLCAVGSSDLAGEDEEMSKTDAQDAATGRLADQLKGEVNRMVERYVNVLSQSSTKKTGALTVKTKSVMKEKSMKETTKKFQKMKLEGLRFESYHFHPNRASPEKTYVLACVPLDYAAMTQSVADTVAGEANGDLQKPTVEIRKTLEATRLQLLNKRR